MRETWWSCAVQEEDGTLHLMGSPSKHRWWVAWGLPLLRFVVKGTPVRAVIIPVEIRPKP